MNMPVFGICHTDTLYNCLFYYASCTGSKFFGILSIVFASVFPIVFCHFISFLTPFVGILHKKELFIRVLAENPNVNKSVY